MTPVLFSCGVVPRGFEPRQTESKSVVLSLYYGTKMICKNKGVEEVPQFREPVVLIFITRWALG